MTKRTDFDIRTDMNTMTVSVTDFRDHLAEYLNAVRFEKQRLIVKKNRSIMAQLVPPVSAKDKVKKQIKRRVPAEAFGMWKNRKDMQGPIEKVAARLRETAWRGNYDNR